jgi:hypothetical protein
LAAALILMGNMLLAVDWMGMYTGEASGVA